MAKSRPRRTGLTILSAIAISSLLAAEIAILCYSILDRLWTPFAFGDMAFMAGGFWATGEKLYGRTLIQAVWRGVLVFGLLYGIFLLATGGMIAANTYAVQLPARIGPVYRYDPRTGQPDASIVRVLPEAPLVAHLEGEATFPQAGLKLAASDNSGKLRFASDTPLHRVASYEIGPVLIRRVPGEAWWNANPRFVASIRTRIKFASGEQRDFSVEMLAEFDERDDHLGLFTQGYLTPNFQSWSPGELRPAP